MKRKLIALAVLAMGSVGATWVGAMAQSASSKVEYIDIRWDGVERMCVIFPDGRVNFSVRN